MDTKTIQLPASIDDQGRLRIDIATGLPAGEVELNVTVRPTGPTREPSSQRPLPPWVDLIGRLRWQGDAVAHQRRLRDEWPD
jgi:hypothetical protein